MRRKGINTTKGGNIMPLILCAALALSIFSAAMFWLSMRLDTSLAIKQKNEEPVPAQDASATETPPDEQVVESVEDRESSLIDAAVEVATDEEVQDTVVDKFKQWREDRKKKEEDDQ